MRLGTANFGALRAPDCLRAWAELKCLSHPGGHRRSYVSDSVTVEGTLVTSEQGLWRDSRQPGLSWHWRDSEGTLAHPPKRRSEQGRALMIYGGPEPHVEVTGLFFPEQLAKWGSYLFDSFFMFLCLCLCFCFYFYLYLYLMTSLSIFHSIVELVFCFSSLSSLICLYFVLSRDFSASRASCLGWIPYRNFLLVINQKPQVIIFLTKEEASISLCIYRWTLLSLFLYLSLSYV